MTKPLRFENKSLRLKYKCLICIWIIFWAILDLFINPKYLFQNKSFSQTYYFKSEKSFVILTSLLGLKINPGNLESTCTWKTHTTSYNSSWVYIAIHKSTHLCRSRKRKTHSSSILLARRIFQYTKLHIYVDLGNGKTHATFHSLVGLLFKTQNDTFM